MEELATIQSKIYEIRGQRVMLDRDLAELYGVTTGNLNKAVKRNIERFPERFMFQLTEQEFLIFQNGTSSWGGTRKRPYAFTEQGVSMLSAVLRSPTAIQVSIRIMDAFVAMRNYIMTTSTMTAELSEIRAKLTLLERADEDNAEAVNDLSEDMRKELDNIYGSERELLRGPGSLFGLADRFLKEPQRAPRMYIACGTEDFLFEANEHFFARFGKELPIEYHTEPGSHTWDHTYITKLSQEGLFANLNRLDDTLQSIAGVRTVTMRPPGGFVSDNAKQNLAKKGVPAILWSIDTLDWKTKNAQNTINVVLSSVKDGDIILMHDLYGTSADAAVVLIPELKKRGYQLVTVSEMASLRGGMTPGQVYHSFRP